MRPIFKRYRRSYREFHYVNASIVDPQERLLSMLKLQHEYQTKKLVYVKTMEHDKVIEEWRSQIAEWAFNVSDFYCFSRETVCIALSFLDRYMETQPIHLVSNHNFQVASICSLFIACKLFERKPISMKRLLAMSGYKITKNEVEDMEWVLLDKNEWMLHPPTALSFARLLLGFLTVATKKIRLIIEIAHHLVELSACDSFFLKYDSSTIAMAAIVSTFHNDNVKIESRDYEEWLAKVDHHTGIRYNDEIERCKYRLDEILGEVARIRNDCIETKSYDMITRSSCYKYQCKAKKNKTNNPSPISVEECNIEPFQSVSKCTCKDEYHLSEQDLEVKQFISSDTPTAKRLKIFKRDKA